MSGVEGMSIDVALPAIAGGLLAAGAVAIAVMGLAVDNPNRPPLVGSVKHDFGVVELSSTNRALRHTFILRNQSKKTVHIKDVRTTCGCTDASVDVNSIPPGGLLHVSATLHLSSSGTREA
jgi:Protein of unknown function (DUF1573)